MKKSIVLLFLCVTVVFGVDNSDIIWTWGNGNSIASIFSFLYFLLNIDSLETLIKISGILGMLIVFAREWFKGEGFIPTVLAMKMFFFFVIAYGTINFFLTVKQDAEHRVYILSANELSSASWAKCRPVNGDNECYAPIGIKLIFSTLTNFEKAGVSSMESAMMDANALTYSFSSMGYGFGLNYAETVSKLPVNANQYNTFMEFYENCLLYDFADGTKKINDLYTNKDLALFLLSTNSRLTTVYNTANPNGIVKACFEVAETDLLGSNTCTTKVISMMASSKGTPASETDVNSICTAGENFTQALFDSTKTADDNIKQNISIKLMNEALVNSAITSGISPSDLAYGTTMAQREMQGKWTTMGILAKEYIPSMRGIMQGIAIGLTWVLALMSIATASPAPYLGSIIGFQVTLMLWSFMLALINFMMIDRITGAISIMFIPELGAGDQLTLMTSGAINEELQKGMAFLGYMAVASYGVSAGLVKIGGNMLSSLGNGVGQISVGMGVSSDMARGHQNYGLTEASSKGVQSVNKRGGIDVVNADGSQEHRNLNGVDTNIGTDGSGTKQTTQTVNGKRTTTSETTGGNKAGYNGENVTGVDLSSGTTGAIQGGVQASASQERARAMQNLKTAENAHTSAIQNQITVGTDAIKTASQTDGSDFTTTKQEAEKRAFSKTLDEMVANKEIDSNTKEKAMQWFAGQQAQGGVKFDSGSAVWGAFTKGATGLSVNAELSAKGGWQGTSTDKDAHQTALEKSFTDKMTKNYTNEASSILTSSNKVDQSVKDDFASKFSDTQTTSNQTSHSYKEAVSVAQTATEKEQYTKTHGASVSKDIAQQYLQEVADKAGGGDAGQRAIVMELNRLENSRYAEATFREYMERNVPNNLNVGTQIDNASTQVQASGNGITGGRDIQNREENDDKAREQGMLNDSYVRSKTHRGRTEH